MKDCPCKKIGKGVQVFRLRGFPREYVCIVRLGPLPQGMIEKREMWRCKVCNSRLALVAVNPYGKGFEDVLVRMGGVDEELVDWSMVADTACECGWRGSACDRRYVD